MQATIGSPASSLADGVGSSPTLEPGCAVHATINHAVAKTPT